METGLNNLAQLLRDTNRLGEAEALMRRALAIEEKGLGADHPDVARDLSNMAQLLKDTNRLAEAEPLMRRALAIDEKSFGPNHPNVGVRINNLAMLLMNTNRVGEVEPLLRRVISIFENALGKDHPNVSTALNNLALLLQKTKRFAEAEPLMRRALVIDEKSFGPDHPNVALHLNNLAVLLEDMSQLSEAERLMRRALVIDEKSFGPDHPNVALHLNNLAVLLCNANRLDEAEPVISRALSISEKSLGPDHPSIATELSNLAALNEQRGNWAKVLELFVRAKPILIGAHGASERMPGDLRKAILGQHTADLRAYARALYHADAKNTANLAQSFELAQWALQNSAADALTSMAARFAKGDQELATLVREQQDLLSARQGAFRNLDVAAGRADARAAEAARASISEIEAKLTEKVARLHKDFPDYAELANPKPLSLGETQSLLGDRQALVLFLDLWQYSKVPEETIVFALTGKEARWSNIPLGIVALRERISALRCGLDSASWRDEEKSRENCKKLLGTEATDDQLPPFDVAAAHALYHDLFDGIADLIKDKSLLIVPTGALTQFPFEALVTEKPDETLPRFESYKSAVWLGQRQAITMLPSVGSLKALRTAKTSAAGVPFIGFGNPLLDGIDGKDKRAWDKQTCPKSPAPKQTRNARHAASLTSLFRNGQVNVEDLRHQPPLPETADELCEIAHSLSDSRICA